MLIYQYQEQNIGIKTYLDETLVLQSSAGTKSCFLFEDDEISRLFQRLFDLHSDPISLFMGAAILYY